MSKHELWELQSMQAAPLSVKIALTRDRIKEWVKAYGEDGVYISFSGGKDSTVLLHLVRELYPDIPAVFCDVPTQYPELKEFASSFENVNVVKPRIGFAQVCEKYGFPLISKEVSETVSGARKYLTRIIGQESLGNERTNERTQYRYCFERLCGLGKYEPKNSRASGYNKNAESELINLALSICGFEKVIDNQRVQIMMGLLLESGKATAENTPENGTKSMFSCERYKFFLDAPFEISNKCCTVMKKEPMRKYEKETGRVPMTAQMASESKLRTQVWLRQGCNSFNSKHAVSNPMAFWTEQDVLLYVWKNNIPICSVYGDVVKDNEIEGQFDFEDLGIFDLGIPVLRTTGCDRTGCMLCGFGCHLDKGESRFERLHRTHPKMYSMLDVMKNNGMTMREAIEWTNKNGNLNIRI